MQRTALHCTALHLIALRWTGLHYTALHCTERHCISLGWTALNCTTLHYNALHCTALHCNTLYCIVLHCTALHCTSENYSIRVDLLGAFSVTNSLIHVAFTVPGNLFGGRGLVSILTCRWCCGGRTIYYGRQISMTLVCFSFTELWNPLTS